MELNDKNLEVLAAGLKIAKEDLTKALTTDEEFNLERIVYTDEEWSKLEKNIKDQEYHKGKEAGFEMPLKDLKKDYSEKYGVETEGIKDFKELFDKVLSNETTKLKETFNGNAGDKEKKFVDQIEELKKTEQALREKLQETESTWEQKLQAQMEETNVSIVNNQLLKIADSIPFAVPKEVQNGGKEKIMDFVNKQKDIFLTTYKSKYDFSFEDKKFIIKSGEETVKNNLLEPVDPSEHALEFAKSNYFNLTENQVINRDGSQKYGNTFHGMPLEDFQAKMKQEGHHPHSNEYAVYLSEWQDKNK